MPIYEYKCQNCGAHVEKMQKISDAPLTVCENCGGKLEKQISRSGFQFKGEGWYVTDYADKKKSDGGAVKSTKKEESSAGSEKSSTAESTAKTDSASKSAETKSSSEK